ncbi:MAG: BrnT family toxin [Acidobacteriota bacterium]|nr:MAG: BrnT family toxin [Acidobacteriota bacterium]
MRYDFEWDPKKARTNIRKHAVSFERAATVFRDPNLLSIPDEEHSEKEERWITIGLDGMGSVLVLSHKCESLSAESMRIRIISVRKATKRETEQYEKGI